MSSNHEKLERTKETLEFEHVKLSLVEMAAIWKNKRLSHESRQCCVRFRREPYRNWSRRLSNSHLCAHSITSYSNTRYICDVIIGPVSHMGKPILEAVSTYNSMPVGNRRPLH